VVPPRPHLVRHRRPLVQQIVVPERLSVEIERPAVLFAESLCRAFSRFYGSYAVDVEEAGLQVRRVESWGCTQVMTPIGPRINYRSLRRFESPGTGDFHRKPCIPRPSGPLNMIRNPQPSSKSSRSR
jgi:hypothetical protein